MEICPTGISFFVRADKGAQLEAKGLEAMAELEHLLDKEGVTTKKFQRDVASGPPRTDRITIGFGQSNLAKEQVGGLKGVADVLRQITPEKECDCVFDQGSGFPRGPSRAAQLAEGALKVLEEKGLG